MCVNLDSVEPRDPLIERAYLEGASLREVAKDWGISHERVRQILIARGVELRSTPKRKLDGALKTLATPLNVRA